MNDIFIGALGGIMTILLLETFKSLDGKLFSALTLVGIAYIYVGFAWHEPVSLGIVIVGTLIFTALAYFGYTYKLHLIIAGFLLHGVWDLVYPLVSNTLPEGYDKFCFTFDVIIAIYLYLRRAKLLSK
jgi:hypothetical protein